MRQILHPDDARPIGRTIVVDACIAVVLAGWDLLPHGLRPDDSVYGFSLDFDFPPSLIALVAVTYLPLLWRQRAPLAVLAVVAVAHAAGWTVSDPAVGGLALLATLYAVASLHALPLAGPALAAIVLVESALLGITEDPAIVERLRTLALDAAIFATPWGLGCWSRVRRLRQGDRERARQLERGARAQRAVADERERMARELHDILAHSISVMVLQASGGREILPVDRARAGAALEQIEATGRQSLVEVRRLLGLLQDDYEQTRPASGLARLDTLIGEVRDAGLPVRVELDGAPVELPPSIDLAAYRIVQEALTNVLKHAPHATATLRIVYGDALDVEITDDGRFSGAQRPPSRGRGLVGMHERVRLAGGELEAGPGPQGGFRVKAILPIAVAERVS